MDTDKNRRGEARWHLAELLMFTSSGLLAWVFGAIVAVVVVAGFFNVSITVAIALIFFALVGLGFLRMLLEG